MTGLAAGARQLPTQHVSIRVPWHDSGWAGTVCSNPTANNSCLVLRRIGADRQDEVEEACKGRSWQELAAHEIPVCLDERGAFMAPFDVTKRKPHPYAKSSSMHEHFLETPYTFQEYAAAAVPFRWMLKSVVEGKRGEQGLAEKLSLGWMPDREPKLDFDTAWVQDQRNQLVLLDTFFSALKKQESLCFFYAKRTPLSEDSRRVLVGVGRVLSKGSHVEYRYSVERPPLRGVLWERNIGHSVRPDSKDGFLFPYQALQELANEDPSISIEDYVAFAPEDHWLEFSYGSEHVSHDGAIASLLECVRVVKKLDGVVAGQWKAVTAWLDAELNRLWRMRGAYPGLGSALTALGIPNGTLVACEIARALDDEKREAMSDPWPRFDAVVKDPSRLSKGVANEIGKTHLKVWEKLKPERRSLLKLLSRLAMTEQQATRYFQPTERSAVGIEVADKAILENPYLLYELDRRQPDPIAFGTVDRGLFPDPLVTEKYPIPKPSVLDDAVDGRRVRAVIADTLETARLAGHTLQASDDVIHTVRHRVLSPECPLSEDVLAAVEDGLSPTVGTVELPDGKTGFQLDFLAEAGALVSSSIEKRLRGKRHAGTTDWSDLIDTVIDEALPSAGVNREQEEQARREKAAAIEELFSSRVSVLIGAAGTGKTTLLKALVSIPEVRDRGVLLLAPTGKARVRLETQVGMRGAGRTIAQFLRGYGRFDIQTGNYLVTRSPQRDNSCKTVIVDEASMLTEEQLAALIDSIAGVERLVLSGDPRQLPPIGAGRPFVDIVRRLARDDVESRFPKVARGYAELTVNRRQLGQNRADLLLAQWFGGRPCDPGADEIWDRVEAEPSSALRLVEWASPDELEERFIEVLVEELELAGPDDEHGFEATLGGSLWKGSSWFNTKWKDKPGSAESAERWQILSPVRAGIVGVDAINREIQRRFRKQAIDLAHPDVYWQRSIPKPFGPQGILYGDKVISVTNGTRKWTYPKDSGVYIANGDIGVAVGHRKTRKKKWYPKILEVEFANELGTSVHYQAWEFGDEGANPLELAYALTVHKAQGSEFGLTFVVIPNPCWLLSRELLYTAMTRQRQRIVLLHQGPLRDLRKYSDAFTSDTARRMTNLFTQPKPVKLKRHNQTRMFEDGLIHRTERGELVRLKSELVIADRLHARNIDYEYESPLQLGSSIRYPDFTIQDDEQGVNFYWEHLGLLHDPAYRSRWNVKLALYREHGIVPHEEGGGPEGTLIITADDAKGGLDASAVAALIDRLLG